MSQYVERQQRLGFEWIKSKHSGRTFLCPVGAIADKEHASEAELVANGVDESDNPHND